VKAGRTEYGFYDNAVYENLTGYDDHGINGVADFLVVIGTKSSRMSISDARGGSFERVPPTSWKADLMHFTVYSSKLIWSET
jgi:hypothetical protein